MTERVDGKVTIVSGSGSSGPGYGVGKATSVLFAREGARVMLVDKVKDRALETLDLIKDEGGEAAVVEADITDPKACEHIVAETLSCFGRLDILINNAAISPLVSMLDTTPDLYAQVMAVNTTGTFLLTKAALPALIEGGGGAIANIVSVAAIRGTGVSQTAYSTSKAAILGMASDIACAYGKQGVRINSIAPGHIVTPMRDIAVREMGLNPSTFDAGVKTALGIEGDAWDIARAALFLCSPEARFITGVLLPVDGGTTARNP